MAAITLLIKVTKHVQENAQKFVLAKKTESSQLNDILGWFTIGLLPSPCLAPDIDLIKQIPSQANQVLHGFLTFPLTPTSIILGLSITLASLSPFSTIPMIQLWLPWIGINIIKLEIFSCQQSDVPPAFPYLCIKRPPLPSASRSGDRQTPQGRDLGGDIYNVGINSPKKFESPWARPQGWPLSFSRAEDNLSMWASTGRLWMTKLT